MVLIDITKIAKDKLPANLTKVPAIWNSTSREILYEAKLLDFLKEAIANRPPPPPNREIMPANIGNFAYLDETDDLQATGNFSFVNVPIEKIQTPDAEPMPGGQRPSFTPRPDRETQPVREMEPGSRVVNQAIAQEPRVGQYSAPDSRGPAMSLEDLQALRDADSQAWMAKNE